MKEFEPAKEDTVSPDPDLFVMVRVRNKETGETGMMALYNEDEVDRRIKFVEERLPATNDYQGALERLKEFHRARREAWELLKEKTEIFLPPKTQ